MTNGKSFFPWSGVDERLVVDEMIRNQSSLCWEESRQFVKRCVYAKAKNIPSDLQEDIIQEVMYKITKYLPHFRFRCTLKLWLNRIIEVCIIDVYRRLQSEGLNSSLFINPPSESDREGEELNASTANSAEDAFEANDEIRNGIMALLEYANTHTNPVRARLIIRMVIFEGETLAEAAKAAGCHAPVAGYIVREAQSYAREKMGHTRSF